MALTNDDTNNATIISSSGQLNINTTLPMDGLVYSGQVKQTEQILTEESVRKIFREELDRLFKKMYLKGLEDGN